MKIPHTPSPRNAPPHTAFRGGSYSLMLTAVVLAIVIALNLLVSFLPDALTHYDISASKLYSVTSSTKTVLSQLQEDVSIYWIVQADQEDDILENLLSKYESLSDHITVVKKNPDVYPTFAQQYTDEPVQNNSLVVECGDRSRYIGLDDIYVAQPDLSLQSVSASFDGEGAITSAIDYVTDPDQPKLYLLEGHGEPELSPGFSDQLTKANMEVEPLSLLGVDAIPEDADCVMIYAPQRDFSPEETDLLAAYVEGGGQLFVSAGPSQEGPLPNLFSLLEPYGVTTVDGIVVEAERDKYAFRQPHALLAAMEPGPITDPLIEERYLPVFPIAQGLTLGSAPEGVEVVSLLDSSPQSFSKAAGYELETYDKEEGDVDGPFSVAVDVQTQSGGEILWFASSVFLDDLYNAYSSGANLDLAMNALSSLVGESDAMAIRTKSLNYTYLTIDEATASLLKVTMIGVFPLVYLGVGLCIVVRRKRRCTAPA